MSSELNAAVQSGPGFTPQSAMIRDILSAELWLSSTPVMKFDEFVSRKTEIGTAPGRTISMPRLSNLKLGGRLAEGNRIQTRAMAASQTQISVSEYGNAVGFTEELIRSSFMDVMSAAAVLLGRDFAMVLDLDLRNSALQAPNVIYANGKTARTQLVSTDLFSTEDVRRSVEILDTNNTPRIGDGYLVCFCTPHQASSIRKDPDWVAAHKYGLQQALFKGEIGQWEGVRFVVTTVMPSGANLAKDAFTGDYVNVGADPALANGVLGNQTTIYKAIIFGDAAVAHAIGQPVEMRDNPPEDFGREHGIAWLARWGSGQYDTNNSVVIETA